MILQTIGAFFATVFFSIIFNVNKKQLIYCGFVGAIGWLIYLIFISFDRGQIFSTFIAAFVISITSRILAIARKNPVTIYQVAGIIPIVPGGLLYRALLNLITNRKDIALDYLVETVETAGAIAAAILFVSSLLSLFSKLSHKYATSN